MFVLRSIENKISNEQKHKIKWNEQNKELIVRI